MPEAIQANPTQAATPPTEALNQAVTEVTPTSFEERSAAVFGNDSESSAEGEAASTNAVTPPEPDAAAKARAERRAALDKLKSEERGKVDAMAALRERDTLRARVAELEAQGTKSGNVVDLDSLDEDGLLGLLERTKRVSPQKIGERLRELIANPELAAAYAAQQVVDPKIAAIEKQNAELKERLEELAQERARERESSVERAAAEQFFAFTKSNADASPLAARFLDKHGPEKFYSLALSAAQGVPEFAGEQAILDEIEEQLASLQLHDAQAASAQTQRRQAPPTPNHAAAQAPTHVTNSLAQQRSSVVDEETDWAKLPFEERSARAFR